MPNIMNSLFILIAHSAIFNFSLLSLGLFIDSFYVVQSLIMAYFISKKPIQFELISYQC